VIVVTIRGRPMAGPVIGTAGLQVESRAATILQRAAAVNRRRWSRGALKITPNRPCQRYQMLIGSGCKSGQSAAVPTHPSRTMMIAALDGAQN
jgi:hypothetical protein